MNQKTSSLHRSLFSLFGAVLFLTLSNAQALDLNWSGQFRAESNRISNYNLDSSSATRDTTRESANGYYIPGGGEKTAQFQTLFMRLNPSAIVNDNVALHTEFWLGNPVTGLFGSAYPGSSRSDLRQYNSNFSAGGTVSAQRFWADFLTDFGVLQVGRAPLNWGLGLVHSSGDGIWDRYQSTGDVVRLSSKFGNFTLLPSFSKINYGNAVGGSYVTSQNLTGGGGVSEYSLGLKYQSPEEEMDTGVNIVRRLAGANTEFSGFNGVTSGGLNMTIWDIYAQKKINQFQFKMEAPLYSGSILGTQYKAYALALEGKYQFNDSWAVQFKAGRAPGQQNSVSSTTSRWNMAYFNPNYRLGMFLFNYQLRNFAGPKTGTTGDASIYDNPVTNANYLQLGGSYKTDKWTLHLDWFAAKANTAAETGNYFFNSWDRKYVLANSTQSKNLGVEIDWGATFDWDQFTTFGLDFGWFMPGGYYAFSNDATTSNKTDNVFGVQAKVGIKF